MGALDSHGWFGVVIWLSVIGDSCSASVFIFLGFPFFDPVTLTLCDPLT